MMRAARGRGISVSSCFAGDATGRSRRNHLPRRRVLGAEQLETRELLSSVSTPSQLVPSPGSTSESIGSEQAMALALNQLSELETGYLLENPRYAIEFTADGVRVDPRRGPDWQWQLTFIGAGDGPVSGAFSEPVKPRSDLATLVQFDRGAIVEQYLVRARSVEQQFLIAAPLALGDEDLVLVGSVRSPGRFETQDREWIWRDESGSVSLGHVFVFDARRQPIAATMQVTADSTRIVVDGDALASAVYPVTIDPEIGSNDFRISNQGPDGNANFDAEQPSVAYNSIANEYLVVWVGDTNAAPLVDNEFEVYGQRLNGTTGAEIGTDFRISDMGPDGSTSFRVFAPRVAYNSTNNEYLVVWAGDDAVDNEFEIFGQRLSAVGAEIGTNDFRISDMGPDGNTSFFAFNPDVVYNSVSNEYLVVWRGDDNTAPMVDNEFEIFGQRLSNLGAEIGTNDFRISDMGTNGSVNFAAQSPAVAYNSTNNEYLVVWQGDDNTAPLVDNEFEAFGQLLSAAGVEIGANDFRISDLGPNGNTNFGVFRVDVAYNSVNNEYLVIFGGDDTVDDEQDIYGQRLNAATGAAVGSNDFRITTIDVSEAVVAYNSVVNEYLIVFADPIFSGLEILGQRIDAPTGTLIGTPAFRLSDTGPDGDSFFNAFNPAVAYNPTHNHYLVVFDSDDDTPPLVGDETEIFGQLYAPDCGLTVTTTNDLVHNTDGVNSLREAIICANTLPGLDTISFAIPGAGPHAISPASALPVITDPVIIDGYTQGSATPDPSDDARANTLAIGNDAVIKIELNGTGAGAGANGLRITAGSSTVRGLAINRFAGNGIEIQGGGGNRIEGSFIGTDPGGTLDRGNAGNGVRINGSSNNTIGGTTPATANIIAFNDGRGVSVEEAAGNADGNAIRGNSIHSSGGLGIDLEANGLTPNDLGAPPDSDGGANNRQNFPMILTASSGQACTGLFIDFASTPNTTFDIEVFSTPITDPDPFEGRTFIGRTQVTTNAMGLVTDFLSFLVGGLMDTELTATATAPSGDTSEFSNIMTVAPHGLDFGDAPNTHATLLGSNGARHELCNDVRLGASGADPEADGQPNATGTGDDVAGFDDETGVTFGTLTTGAVASITVNAPVGGRLDAFIDFNRDGDFADSGEKVFNSVVLAAGNNILSAFVPATASLGGTMARFRISSAGGLSFNGFAPDGEVEDYQVSLVAGVDFGDAPDSYRTRAADNGARHTVGRPLLGTALDSESDGQPTADASGDDSDPGLPDDEDGVTFNTALVPGQMATVTVVSSDNFAELEGFFDWNADGNFGSGAIIDTGEQVFDSVVLSQGPNMLSFTVPAGAVVGSTFARFRLSFSGGLSFDGLASGGEVEDYQVTVAAPPEFDFGDAPASYGTLLADNGPRHRAGSLFFGSGVDAESDGLSSAFGDADDLAGSEPFDLASGITFSPLVPGTSATVSIPVSAIGRVDAFVDWNDDGDFADAGEKILNNRAVAAGTTVIPITVPATATGGADNVTMARFRLSSLGGLSFNGSASDGEVEDFSVDILPPELDFGDAPASYGTATASHIVLRPFLGSAVDSEAAAQTSADALGDDVDPGLPDDEDGVTISALTIGSAGSITVISSDNLAEFDAFIDFNRDGDFDEPNETIFPGNRIVNAGSNLLTFLVPATASPGTTFARFRISFSSGLSFDGAGGQGEVEDYQVTIAAPPVVGLDFGDAPRSYGTLLADGGPDHLIGSLFFGSGIDAEPDGQPSTFADADDLNGAEPFELASGITFTALVPGGNATFTVPVSAAGRVDAFIDWNDDGDFADSGEKVLHNVAVVTGVNNLSVAVPATATGGADGITFARFRLSSIGGLSFLGSVPDGEVEDFSVDITAAPANTAPDAVPDSDSTPEDVAKDITVLSNDSDGDGDTLTLCGLTQPPNGTTSINSNGTIRYEPDPNFFGSDTFDYTVCDGRGGSDSATVTVDVTPVVDPPDAVDDIRSTAPDTPVNITVLSNDSDPDGNPITIVGLTQPAAGTGSVTQNADGTITYTPPLGFLGIASFTYTIDDGTGRSDTATVTITVGLGCRAGLAPPTAAGEGNVRGTVSNGRLIIQGDAASNDIQVLAGGAAGSFVVAGRGRTTVNGSGDPVQFDGVTGAIQVRLGMGNDNLMLDGSVAALALPGKLTIRMDGGDDAIWLDTFDVAGRVRIRAGKGSDVVAIIDALLEHRFSAKTKAGADEVTLCDSIAEDRLRVKTGKASDAVTMNDLLLQGKVKVVTGKAGDTVSLEQSGDATGPATVAEQKVKIKTKRGNDTIGIGVASQPGNTAEFQDCVKIRGGKKRDRLDAGISSDPNGNGNTFMCGPRVNGVEEMPS